MGQTLPMVSWHVIQWAKHCCDKPLLTAWWTILPALLSCALDAATKLFNHMLYTYWLPVGWAANAIQLAFDIALCSLPWTSIKPCFSLVNGQKCLCWNIFAPDTRENPLGVLTEATEYWNRRCGNRGSSTATWVSQSRHGWNEGGDALVSSTCACDPSYQWYFANIFPWGST